MTGGKHVNGREAIHYHVLQLRQDPRWRIQLDHPQRLVPPSYLSWLACRPGQGQV